MKHLETLVTDYNEVDVWENASGGIDFDVIGATHATWHPRHLMTGHAWDALTAAVLFHPGPVRSLLMLGLGGGTVLRQLRHFLPRVNVTAVEIDEGMIRLARTYMNLDALQIRVVHADAYEFLSSRPQTYDVVVDDLYRCGDRDVERPRALDARGLEALRRRLKPQGLLAMNFITGAGHRAPHREAKALLRRAFPHTAAVRPPLSHNEALLGTTHPDGLRSPRDLRRLGHHLPTDEDRRRWKELRFLQLR